MKIVDFGKRFGQRKYCFGFEYENNKKILNFLIKDIKRNFKKEDKILIGDWGGGNGILSKSLLDFLSQYKKIEITIIDLDDSKFVKRKRIKNIKADIIKYKPKKKFDYSIMREVLHYNSSKNQKKLLKNISLNTKKGFLLENYFIEKEQENEWKKINIGLKKLVGIYRSIPNLKFIENELRKEWSLILINKIFPWSRFGKQITIRQYFINRFGIKEKYYHIADKYFPDKKMPNHAIIWCKNKTTN